MNSSMIKLMGIAGCVLLLVAKPTFCQSQETKMLSQETAQAWAKLVLKGVDTEFPNKMSLVYENENQLQRPRENFPAFYGCFDWHSSVHGHWVLARLLRQFPDMPIASEVRTTLSKHLTAGNLRREADFFAQDQHKSFERMYGWAWYLRLVIELDQWDDKDANLWRENLRPLENILVDRIKSYLPNLSYPIRVGQHTDTGFALGQIIDYARALKNKDLERLAVDRSLAFYNKDIDYPIHYEPSGHDFFSSAWNEADLMRRILDQNNFGAWLERFVPKLDQQLIDGTIAPVKVTDMTDGKLIHLAGLNLHRAWCMASVASVLPKNTLRHKRLLKSSASHLRDGIAYINSGHYEGDHWLATFALYAITETGSPLETPDGER